MGNEKKTKQNIFQKYGTKKIIKWMWLAFGGLILFVTIIFALISAGIIGYMPDVEELENPIDKYASQVYSSDGALLGTYSLAKNNRIYSN